MNATSWILQGKKGMMTKTRSMKRRKKRVRKKKRVRRRMRLKIIPNKILSPKLKGLTKIAELSKTHRAWGGAKVSKGVRLRVRLVSTHCRAKMESQRKIQT